MQAQTGHNSGQTVRRVLGITTGRVIVTGADRDSYIQRCLRSNTVDVLAHSGQIVRECLLLTPRATSEDGVLEMLGIPRNIQPTGVSEAKAKEIKTGLLEGTEVIIFPLEQSPFSCAVLPIAAGIDPDMLRLWSEHQRRDRHTTPGSTYEMMEDGEGGFNVWYKTYGGEEQFGETSEAHYAGFTASEVRSKREQRLVSTTRMRITPSGKLIISLAKKADELGSVENLENVKNNYGQLDAFDNENSPHIVIDPDSAGNGAGPSIHVDSKDSTIDMDKDKIKIRHKVNKDEIIMENGKIRITVGSDGVVELNGATGNILSTKNLPACLVTGTPFMGSVTEKTKR